MITLSPAHEGARAAAAIAATLAMLNSGTGGANVSLYATARPANGTVAGGSPLAVFTLLKPAGSITAGVLSLSQPPEAMIIATGVALWARITVDSGPVLDCDVSDMAGTAMIRLANTQLYAGGYVRLASGTLS